MNMKKGRRVNSSKNNKNNINDLKKAHVGHEVDMIPVVSFQPTWKWSWQWFIYIYILIYGLISIAYCCKEPVVATETNLKADVLNIIQKIHEENLGSAF